MNDLSWAAIKRLVYERANGVCEYCQTSEENIGQTMQVDHIDPQAGDALDNLCLTCWNCNSHKHKATLAVDPEAGEKAALFSPRSENWSDHFKWIDNAAQIDGLTPTGRATVVRLKMNRPAIIIARKRWVAGGYHPPATNPS
ncbi:MAG: HNH endonuclease [Burkholderiales bacterium]|nr:HNH endonuclease [Anaerolineae bacterium]